MKKGFTFIEVLISVAIISVVILSLTEIFSNNRQMILFIDKKGISTFNSSLFVNENLEKYDKSTKSAYDILYQIYQIKNDNMRKYLQNLEKNITLNDARVIKSEYGFEYLIQDNIIFDNTIKNSYFKIAPTDETLNFDEDGISKKDEEKNNNHFIDANRNNVNSYNIKNSDEDN